MAVDSSNNGGSTVPATGTPTAGTPSATLTGIPAVSANGKGRTRKRPSSLLAQATSLPSVESSLDEFIARANETLVDTSAFNAEKARKEEDERRREADALRWKAAEQQLRESQAREEALRRQLDGLQGKLAEAEARAAVASAGGTQDGIIADLKVRLTAADERVREAEERARSVEERLREAEERAGKLAQELVAAKAAAAAVPSAPETLSLADQNDLEQRLRVAETKAAKAIAAAKAAAMGLTVSPADIAAIESGLIVPMDLGAGKKSPNWALTAGALVVGAVVAFAAAFVIFKKDPAPATAAAPAPAVQQAQPQAAPPVPAQPAVTPTVTPIEDTPPAAAAAPTPAPTPAPAAEAPKAQVEVTPIEEPEQPKAAEPAEPAKVAEPAKKAAPAKKKAPAKKAGSTGGLADPFGDTPAPKKKADKPSGGGIVDPF